MAIYGVISLFLFVWLLAAYLDAPYIELWMMAEWMRHLVLSVMFIVCLLLVCTFSQPNPFSVGIGGKNYDPEQPGIVAVTKHPAFAAFALWSGVHIVPNGDVASVIFFGLMCLLSLYGPKSLNDKRRNQLGLEKCQALKNQTKTGWPKIGVVRLGVSILLYVGLLYSHEPVIGVVPYFW